MTRGDNINFLYANFDEIGFAFPLIHPRGCTTTQCAGFGSSWEGRSNRDEAERLAGPEQRGWNSSNISKELGPGRVDEV
jgi:hypothetical protein